MSRNCSLLQVAGLGACLILGSAGCTPAPAAIIIPPTPVSVSYPVTKEVTDFVDFTGRTDAVDSVEVRARVWGYLDKVNFQEGMLVKEGDLLFEIDPRTYAADVEKAEATIALDEAKLKFSEADYQRYVSLRPKGAATQQELDKAMATRDVDAATVRADKAAAVLKKLDLDFCQIKAPISGRVSRAQVTVGNLIQSGETGGTLLTTIVSVDPIYAYFDVDELTVLRVEKAIRAGKVKSTRETDVPVLLGLADETGYPHRGTINFVDNQVNPKTGTLRIRGVFSNKDDAIAPGLFVRVRVLLGDPHSAMLVSDRAIDSDQGQKILYVVNEKNEVVQRAIRLGALHDGMRVIEEGVEPQDRIIVNGMQRVRPGSVTDPKLVEMPVSPSAREAAAAEEKAEENSQPAATSNAK